MPRASDEGRTDVGTLGSILGRGRFDRRGRRARDEQAPTRRSDALRFVTPAELALSSGHEVRWLIHGYVAEGAITEISGPAKSAGKTTFLLRAVRAVLDGGEFLCETTRRSPVVYLSEERETTLAQALGRAGLLDRGDLALLPWRSTIGHDWASVVRAAVRECQRRGARLLVVDTLAPFTVSGRGGENGAADALDALRPLQEAAAAGLAVVIVRHDRKAGGEVGRSGRGSSAFAGAADVLVKVDRSRTSPTARLLTALSRFDETPASLTIELTADGYQVLHDAPPDNPKITLTERVADALLDLAPRCADDALPEEDLLDLMPEGTRRTTLRNVMPNLLQEGILRRHGTGTRGDPHLYWVADTDADSDDA